MLSGSVFLGLCYSLLLIMLARATNQRWILLVYVGLCAGVMYSHEVIRDAPRDALLYSYPLLLALLTYRITSDATSPIHSSRRFKILFCVLFLPLGLLPLIKASFLLISASLAVCCVFLLLQGKQSMLAALCVFPTVVFGILLWRLSGQPLLGLPRFFTSMRPIISGYSESMSVLGNSGEIAIYLVASASILYAAITAKAASILHKATAAISYALFLFISFKEGFVRHDAHAMVASTAIVLAALCSAVALNNKLAVLITVVLFAVVACGYIDSHYVEFSVGQVLTNAVDPYRDALDGLSSRFSSQNRFEARFYEALTQIKKQAPILPLQGTTDIYSFNQSILFASGQTWSPRPVFQSYQAYTADLAKLNAEHLRGNNAPDNILFRVEPIDDRLPSLEDGPSWPLLISNYSIGGADSLFFYLKKTSVPVSVHTPIEIYSGWHALGSEVPVPVTNEGVMAEIDVQPTLLGKLFTTLYKPPELRISMSLSGGETKAFRFIPGMAKAGFVLSPLVEGTKDFVLLVSTGRGNLAKNVVKSFSVSLPQGRSTLWEDMYFVRLTEFNLVHPAI
jgi:hypothetical protein